MTKLMAISSWRSAAILLAVSLALMATIQFIMYPQVTKTLKPLDVQVALSGTEIEEFIGSLEPQQIKAYQINQTTVDMLFPLFYSVALSVLILQLCKTAAVQNKWLLDACFLPFGVAVFDVAENIQIMAALHTYPDLNDALVSGLIIANTVKHLLTATTLSVVLLLVGCLIYRRLRQPRPTAS